MTICDQAVLFRSGEGGYKRYRIPALAVTVEGTVLAFCEGRKHSGGDTDEIDTLLCRSTDGGGTWTDPQIVSDFGGDVAGNPTVVVDRDTGRVWLFNTWNAITVPESKVRNGFGEDSRRVFTTWSDDDGITWAKHKEITRQVKKEEWSWYATGPGHGIQLTRGPRKGRLIVPCDHMMGEFGRAKYWSHVFYSDDHGETWTIGGDAGGMNNECEAVELADGAVMLNMRNWDPAHRNRVVAISRDGGETWGDARQEAALVDPHCAAGICRHSWPGEDSAGILLFVNAASAEGRVKLTLWASYDEGGTWPASKVLHSGPSAYSDIAVLPDGTIVVFHEGGAEHRYDTLILSRPGLPVRNGVEAG